MIGYQLARAAIVVHEVFTVPIGGPFGLRAQGADLVRKATERIMRARRRRCR